MSEIVVIGGGIVGASAAYSLARRHIRVTLVDRADNGQATAAGAGIIAPWSGPFPLAHKAAEYYEMVISRLMEDGEANTGYERIGQIHVATTEVEADRLPEVASQLTDLKRAGASNIGDITLLEPAATQALFPPLGTVYSSVHTSGDARIDGRLMRDALRRAAQRLGARVVSGDAEMEVRADRATGVQAGSDYIPADAVIIASGAWSASFSGMLGVALPVRPQRGQILHLLLDRPTRDWPIVGGFHSHYLLTFPENRVVAGATHEDEVGFESLVTAGGIYEDLREALRVAPGLAQATLKEARAGLRPVSRDGLPIIGRVPSLTNVWVATGHGANGLHLGPYSAELVAGQIAGEGSPIDLSPFSPSRFSHP